MNFKGLTEKEVIENRKKYGTNELVKKKQNTFLSLLIESLGDPIIKILLIALAVKVVILFKNFDWFETIGILIAIFLASFISTISEYGSEKAFIRLGSNAQNIKVKVKRNNNLKEIAIEDVVKNDIVFLNTGDKIPADGYLIEGSILVDESMINGEALEVEKVSTFLNNPKDNNLVYRGSIVYNGECFIKVTEVGDSTIYGKLSSELQESEPTSPLKIRLRELAKVISRIGYIGAILVTISYLFSVIVLANNFNKVQIIETLTNFPLMFNYLLYALTLSVTIIIVAVPEGLPMMITLVLSSNMKRMLKNNVLVRRLVGIETSGNLNVLLTDKTGTLTEGKLEVTEFISGSLKSYKQMSSIKKEKFYKKVYESFYYNNESTFDEKMHPLGGNTTDRALLNFLKNRDIFNYKVINKLPFNSQNKYSMILLDDEEKLTFIKGASEILLNKCSKYLAEDNKERTLINRKVLEDKIANLTKNGSRVLVMAYSKKNLFNNELDNLVLVGIVAIKDELRATSKEGINLIKNAGIDIIMITGDHLDTAKCIAKEAGLITSSDDLAITSKELNLMSDEEVKQK
jgi:calcium-translocating P-type ATPase